MPWPALRHVAFVAAAGGAAPKIDALPFDLRQPELPSEPMPKASSPAAATAAPEPSNYESALQELEGLVARIESGQLPLDEMLAAYQRGAVLLAFCRSKLEAVQDQIKVLDDGQLKAWTSED